MVQGSEGGRTKGRRGAARDVWCCLGLHNIVAHRNTSMPAPPLNETCASQQDQALPGLLPHSTNKLMPARPPPPCCLAAAGNLLPLNLLLQPGCSYADVFGRSAIVYAMFNLGHDCCAVPPPLPPDGSGPLPVASPALSPPSPSDPVQQLTAYGSFFFGVTFTPAPGTADPGPGVFTSAGVFSGAFTTAVHHTVVVPGLNPGRFVGSFAAPSGQTFTGTWSGIFSATSISAPPPPPQTSTVHMFGTFSSPGTTFVPNPGSGTPPPGGCGHLRRWVRQPGWLAS